MDPTLRPSAIADLATVRVAFEYLSCATAGSWWERGPACSTLSSATGPISSRSPGSRSGACKPIHRRRRACWCGSRCRSSTW